MEENYYFSTHNNINNTRPAVLGRKTAVLGFCFALIFSVLAFIAHGQSTAFPYTISVTAIPGKCYDDCRIIIKIFDNNGNEVVINPQTHNAQNLNAYPLYNVQYYYRNVSAGTNVRYDTVNNIQVTNGNYCVGVIGHVPVNTPDGLDYALVDTSICNVEVATTYDHMEASVLSAQARNDYEWYWDENNPRELCGWRPSYTCADRGRIQLKIIKGKYPYNVLIINSNQDTIRNTTFYERQQSGEDSVLANYRDFYTFDQMPVGNYSIRVSDSCDYALWLSINIPDAHPYSYDRWGQKDNNWGDSNVVNIKFSKNCYVGLHDYDKPYFDSILEYRFINPGGDTTQWHSIDYNVWDPNWTYLTDTLHHINRYCDLHEDTVWFQIHDWCRDTIYTSSYYYDYESRCFQMSSNYYITTFDVSTTPDTCIVHANSGLTTQTYNFYGYRCYNYGDSWSDNPYYPSTVYNYFYTAPVHYEVRSAIDSTLIAESTNDSYAWLGYDVTYMVDTVIPVHITWTDAKGCLLNYTDQIYTYNVENYGDMTYPLYVRNNYDDYWASECCWERYLYVREDLDATLFRRNVTVQLFESPLSNSANFTAVCQDGEWSYTTENPDNDHAYVEFGFDEGGWQVTLRDSFCIAPGHYKFKVTTDCNIDTLEYVYGNYYHDSLGLDVAPEYDMTQICDRLLVHPHSTVMSRYFYNIDPYISDDEVYMTNDQMWTNSHVINGVAGGYSEWPDGNGNFVFTIPGQYVVETYTNTRCSSLYHYDTIDFVPVYVDFDQGFAILCDNLSNTGFVSTHAINGSEPYTYYLYDQPDLQGSMIGTSDVGRFPLVPMVAGQQFSVLVEDSCHNSFYINLTATPINQSALAWEFGNFSGEGHCEGDSIHIAALPFAFDVSYQWIGPNGFTSTDRVNHIYLPYGSEGGYYTLEVFNTGCATQVMDSVYIEVIKAPTVTILSDTTVCSGDGVVLDFQVTGNGPVTFDIMHTGAPASGFSTFTANPGSTVQQYYPIESDNLFWPANISDTRCTYDYIIDSVQVSLFNPALTAPPTPYTIDGYACYNHTASLRAISNIDVPYYIFWYQDNRQQNLLQCDTITNPANYSTFYVNNVVGDTTVYVAVSNESRCRATYGAINHIVNMHNGTTTLAHGEGARLFDSGGELGNYDDSETLTHTFICPGENRLDVKINSVDLVAGDTLYVYSGSTTASSALLAKLAHNSSINSLIVNQSSVTFKFVSNWVNNEDGWSIDILTSIPMNTASAHVSPLNYDTVYAVLCTSETPYSNPYFPPLDISQPTEYLKDSLFVSDDNCQTYVHLHVIVNPVSYTDLHDSLMPCQLPITWNGVTFSDFGTQTVTMTNTFGCDSIITMTVHWAPPVDSTTVYDTIVENQLPYHTHGLTFNEPGVQIATLHNQDGCDSIVTVHLYVHFNVTAEADSTICDNELPFVWNGATFTQNDTQTVVLTAHTGADSTLTMSVFVNPTSLTTFTDTTCQYAAYSGFGFTLSEDETTISGFTTLYRTESNIYNCDSVIELHLLITPVITPNFYAEPDKAILTENPDIHFTNITDISDLDGMNYAWTWDFGDGSTDSTYDHQTTHIYTQWGDYTATLTLTVHECVTELSIPVIIEANLEFPNVITPNGDGINDVFIIKDLNPERHNRLVITDRWGKPVFVEENYQTYMKEGVVYNENTGFGMQDINEGVYYYTFYYQGAVREVQFNGSITVIK